jgi:hypothetical protein
MMILKGIPMADENPITESTRDTLRGRKRNTLGMPREDDRVSVKSRNSRIHKYASENLLSSALRHPYSRFSLVLETKMDS